MRDTRYLVNNTYPGLEFIAASGDEGREWTEEYTDPKRSDLYDSTIWSLKLMGKGRFTEAGELLEDIDERLTDLEKDTSPSVVSVLRCWYFGALAYYQYRFEEYDRAERTLIDGHESVVAAVEMKPVVLPMVYRCCDTWLHRARIAREQRRWRLMRSHVDMLREIYSGHEPYCTLSTGEQIYFSDLRNYVSKLDLEDDVQEYASTLFDSEQRRLLADYYTQAIYALNWIPIQF